MRVNHSRITISILLSQQGDRLDFDGAQHRKTGDERQCLRNQLLAVCRPLRNVRVDHLRLQIHLRFQRRSLFLRVVCNDVSGGLKVVERWRFENPEWFWPQ